MAITALALYYFRSLIPEAPYIEPRVYLSFTIFFWVLLVFSGITMGIYRAAFDRNTTRQYYLGGKAYFFAVALMLAVLFFWKETEIPRRFIFVLVVALPFGFVAGRVILNLIYAKLQERGIGIYNALIAGDEIGGMEIFDRFKSFPELGYDIKGFISRDKIDRHEKGPKSAMSSRIKSRKSRGEEEKLVQTFSFTELPNVIRQEGIDRIFIPSPKFVTNGFSELKEICERERVRLNILSPEADQLLRMARVYDVAGITLYSPRSRRMKTIRHTMKRMCDIFGSLILLIIFSPVLLMTTIAVYLESGSPILFKHRRSSTKNGKSFHFYKFRSMIKNADEMKEELLQYNESSGALFKLKNDPRTTRVGKFIRKFSIDELPQLFNVLKGDMSLVGPRPLPVSDYEKVDEGPDFWEAIKDRDSVKPGITGLWQISGRSNLGFREMVLLDLYYIENQSFLFDLEILFETFPTVIFGRGAY